MKMREEGRIVHMNGIGALHEIMLVALIRICNYQMSASSRHTHIMH
jgi:hypothetical protein